MCRPVQIAQLYILIPFICFGNWGFLFWVMAYTRVIGHNLYWPEISPIDPDNMVLMVFHFYPLTLLKWAIHFFLSACD